VDNKAFGMLVALLQSIPIHTFGETNLMNRNMQIGLVSLMLVMVVATLATSSFASGVARSHQPATLLAQRYPLTNRSANFYARSKTSNVNQATHSNRAKR
jgi:hypothetical protein